MKNFFSPLVLLFIFFLLINFNVFAEIPKTDSIKNITALAESDHYIWIGTTHGLWRIKKKDGSVFHLTHENSALPSDSVTGICLDNKNRVWIATRHGILKYDNATFYAVTKNNFDVVDDHFTCIASDADDNIWLGTSSFGILKYTHGKFQKLDNKICTAQGNSILSIWIDKNEQVWTSVLDQGIYLIVGGEWKKLDTDTFAVNNIKMISQDFQKNHLFLSKSDTLFIYDGKEWSKEFTSKRDEVEKIFFVHVKQVHSRYAPFCLPDSEAKDMTMSTADQGVSISKSLNNKVTIEKILTIIEYNSASGIKLKNAVTDLNLIIE